MVFLSWGHRGCRREAWVDDETDDEMSQEIVDADAMETPPVLRKLEVEPKCNK